MSAHPGEAQDTPLQIALRALDDIDRLGESAPPEREDLVGGPEEAEGFGYREGTYAAAQIAREALAKAGRVARAEVLEARGAS